jgi:hypothetical protein
MRQFSFLEQAVLNRLWILPIKNGLQRRAGLLDPEKTFSAKPAPSKVTSRVFKQFRKPRGFLQPVMPQIIGGTPLMSFWKNLVPMND